jgi:hypothetical protein
VNNVGIVGAVVRHFRDGSGSNVEVAREARIARQMWLSDPDVVVAFGITVGAGEPGFCNGLAGGVLVEFANHRGEKGRLRTREVIGAIGVENGAVVFDLEEEVLDHAARKFGALVGDEAQDDEVTVPAIHLVEAAAGNDIGVG